MSKFPCSLTRNMTSHSMENLTFHSLLRWKVIILQILTTSLIQLLLERLGEYTFRDLWLFSHSVARYVSVSTGKQCNGFRARVPKSSAWSYKGGEKEAGESFSWHRHQYSGASTNEPPLDKSVQKLVIKSWSIQCKCMTCVGLGLPTVKTVQLCF